MSDNKDLYFEIEAKPEVVELEHNGDRTVRSYTVANQFKYPYLLINVGFIPLFTIKILKNSLEENKYIETDTAEGYYNVYIKQDKSSLSLGLVHSDNLKAVLLNQLYRKLDKYIMIDSDTKVEGEMMFSYCTSQHY